MFYTNDDSFARLLKAATPVDTHDAWGMQKRLRSWPVIKRWDSGEQIGASSGQWEEQARLIDMAGVFYLEVQQVYHGERYCNKRPAFYRISRRLYEAALAAEGVEA